MERFASVIDSKNICILGYPDKDKYADIATSKINILWTAELEIRDWGIKSIDITIISVKGSIFLTPIEDGDDIEIDFNSSGWEIKDDMEFTEAGTVYPSDITIDYELKTITVE